MALCVVIPQSSHLNFTNHFMLGFGLSSLNFHNVQRGTSALLMYHNIFMSGDNLLGKQPLKFYSKVITTTKAIELMRMGRLELPRHKDTST